MVTPQRTAVLLLSGPNLNLLGSREPEIYGTETLDDHAFRFANAMGDGFEVEHVQSNEEAVLVAAVHEARHGAKAGIVINGGAMTHYAWALHDALAAYEGPVIEVHLSNPDSREPWRHTSVLSPVATGIIAGFGGLGYQMAARALVALLDR